MKPMAYYRQVGEFWMRVDRFLAECELAQERFSDLRANRPPARDTIDAVFDMGKELREMKADFRRLVSAGWGKASNQSESAVIAP